MKPPPAPGGAKTTTLLSTARFEMTDEPVMVQVDPIGQVDRRRRGRVGLIAPVSVDALAFSVTSCRRVASRRLLFPALAVVALKLTVATEGSAKMRSPV